jgi:hypothetical protein
MGEGSQMTMKPISTRNTVSAVITVSFGFFALAGLALAQDQAPHPWRNATDPELQSAQNAPQADVSPQGNASQAGNQNAPDQGPPNQAAPNQGIPNPPPNYGVPARMTIKPGTYITVHVNQWLSSDRNQQGDAFSATLAQPIVVDGIVVAPRGQTIGGRVSEAQKAGRVEGTSRLGVQLTELTLADGQQVPIQTQLINRTGPTSTGRDAAAIGGTTALGAAIGAGADWGRGAAIGAGAGAAAGIIGVLLTRGQPTVIYPESVLTFRIEQPVDFSTERAPQAFRYVDTQDYGQQSSGQAPPRRQGYAYGPPPPPPYAYAYPYPYYGPAYYPYYWGPGFSVYVGPRFYGRGFYRGYRR